MVTAPAPRHTRTTNPNAPIYTLIGVYATCAFACLSIAALYSDRLLLIAAIVWALAATLGAVAQAINTLITRRRINAMRVYLNIPKEWN